MVKQLPIEPNTATGLNRAVTNFTDKVAVIDKKITEILLGKPGIGDKKFTNPIDYGIKPSVDLLASIDLCNIINYAIQQIPGGKKFDPNDKSQRSTVLGRTKYDLQLSAYKIESYITEYYDSNTDLKNFKDPENLNGLQTAISKISQALSFITGPSGSQELFNEPNLNSAFPAMSSYGNFLTSAQTAFDRYADLKNLPNKDIQKVVSYIDKTKKVCSLIQGLNSPTNLISFIDTFASNAISEQIQRLNKLIDPKKIANFVKTIKKACTKMQDVTKFLLKIVNFLRSIVDIAIIVVKVLKVIMKFLVILPIPNLFTVLGISTTVSVAHKQIDALAKGFINRLNEVGRIFNSIYMLCSNVSINLGKIISSLQIVIVNLQNCDDKSETHTSILNSLTESVQTIDNVKLNLDDFVKTYDNNKNNRRKKIGEYAIKILTEEIVDEGINIKRRYGIALDNKEIVVAKSSPTFASEDNIIIQEVKLILASKNLIKSQVSSFSAQDTSTIEDALNYLESDDIDIDFAAFDSGLDDPDNEDEDQENSLGLNAFANKLKGGRKLRRRMRLMLAKQKTQLVQSLQKTDPSGKLSNKLQTKIKREPIKDQIAAHKESIKILKEDIAKLLATAPLSPIQLVILRKKYKEIKDLQKKIRELDATNPAAHEAIPVPNNVTVDNSSSTNSTSTSTTANSGMGAITPFRITAPNGSKATIPLSNNDSFNFERIAYSTYGYTINQKSDAIYILDYFKTWKKQNPQYKP